MPPVIVTADAPESLTVPSIETARKNLSQIAGGTAVIDAETYKRGRASTLKDALDFAPGVTVQSRFGAEESRLSIRGSGIQRTFHGRGLKLLQDGVPLNLADGGFDFQSIDPLSTRDIEIYRGGNALQYGATTLGGAINFVSFSGYDAAPAQVRFEYGSYNSIHAQVSSGMVIGPADYYASLSHSSTDGYRDHSEQDSQRIFANIGYRVNENLETRFFVTYVQTDSELPGELTKDQMEKNPQQPARNPLPFLKFLDHVDSNWKRDYELFRIANRTTYTDGEQSLTLSTFWAWKNLDHPILFWIDQLSNDIGFDLRYDNKKNLFGHENEFTLGYSMVYGVVEDNRFLNVLGNRGAQFSDTKQQSWNMDLYMQDKFSITEDVSIIAGMQFSYASRDLNEERQFNVSPPFSGPNLINNSDRQDWWGYSPKLGVLWDIDPQTQAFFNVSRSFEPASFGELVEPAGGGNSLVQLDPQTATTIEIGTRGNHDRFRWDLAYYYAWLDNELLEYQVLPGVTKTINAGRTIHQGVEATLDIDVLRGLITSGSEEKPGDRLLLRQMYLWNNFHFDNDPTFGDNQLPGIPEHYYRAELVYEHPCGFYCGPNVEWSPVKYSVDSAANLFADPYALLGFKIGYRTKKGFSFFLEGRNLTDEIYSPTTSVVQTATANSAVFQPGDGRSFYAGIEWKW